MKILLVDADCDLTRLLAHAFRQDGYTVVTANHPTEALAQYHSEKPDLVIVDLESDQRGSLQALRGQVHVPVIVLSDLNEGSKELTQMAGPGETFVFKPFRLPDLRLRVRHLGESASRSAQRLVETTLAEPDSRLAASVETDLSLTPRERLLLKYLLLYRNDTVRVFFVRSGRPGGIFLPPSRRFQAPGSWNPSPADWLN